jgi:hypothetical protein
MLILIGRKDGLASPRVFLFIIVLFILLFDHDIGFVGLLEGISSGEDIHHGGVRVILLLEDIALNKLRSRLTVVRESLVVSAW